MIHQDFECEFYFIRHGESQSNATPGFVAGVDHDSPLTDRGFAQARCLGERLKREGRAFDRVYSSSLVRAAQTTETMLEAMGEGGRPFPRVDALVEQRMPGWRGLRVDEVYTPELVAYIRTKGSHFVPPEGESLRMVQRRVSRWIEDEIVYNEDVVASGRSLTVAVVGHGAATKCLMHYLMGFDEALITKIRLANCSITRFRFDRNGWSPICINDSSHVTGC